MKNIIKRKKESNRKQLFQPNSQFGIRIDGGTVCNKRCSHIVELFLRIECSGE